MKKWLWLLVGMLCGASLSSLAIEKVSRGPAKASLTLPAVSAEDASEKAREIMRDGNLGKVSFKMAEVVAVGLPTCRLQSGPTDLFLCEAPVTLKR